MSRVGLHLEHRCCALLKEFHQSSLAILGGLSFLMFLVVREHVKDIRAGQTKMGGRVNTTHETKTYQSGGSGIGREVSSYYMKVNGVSFNISKKIYEWLWPDEEVCVTYWPNTKTVSRVERIRGDEQKRKAYSEK